MASMEILSTVETTTYSHRYRLWGKEWNDAAHARVSCPSPSRGRRELSFRARFVNPWNFIFQEIDSPCGAQWLVSVPPGGNCKTVRRSLANSLPRRFR